MKKIRNISLLMGFLVLAISCDNTVDLTAEFKDIPVVYGVLSPADEDHYIKVERAFLGGDNSNALDIAQIADSLYYENLDVKVEHLNSGDVITLQKVNGEDEGLEREDGIFATSPNWLYKFSTELVEGDEYTLRINRGDNLPEVTATTAIVGSFNFTSPIMPTDINIRYRNFPLSWRKKDGIAFYDVKMLFHFLEEDADNIGIFNERTIQWDIFDNLSADNGGSNTFSINFDGEQFYQFVGGELDDINGRKRIFTSLDFVVDAGAEDLFDYINIGLANTGITSSQVIPTYTNLSEGVGVFSSKNREIYEGFTLKAEARDSLATGIYTTGLGFE